MRRNFPAVGVRQLLSLSKSRLKIVIIKNMETIETTSTVSLTKTFDGTIRIGKSRIALESVIHHFSLGATAQEIAQKFPSLKLPEIYAVIAYFLDNREEVAEYIQAQETESDKLQFEIEPKFQIRNDELRERILERWENRQNISKP